MPTGVLASGLDTAVGVITFFPEPDGTRIEFSLWLAKDTGVGPAIGVIGLGESPEVQRPVEGNPEDGKGVVATVGVMGVGWSAVSREAFSTRMTGSPRLPLSMKTTCDAGWIAGVGVAAAIGVGAEISVGVAFVIATGATTGAAGAVAAIPVSNGETGCSRGLFTSGGTTVGEVAVTGLAPGWGVQRTDPDQGGEGFGTRTPG